MVSRIDMEKRKACAFCSKKKWPQRNHGKFKMGLIKKTLGKIEQFCGKSHRDKFIKRELDI